MKIKFFHLVIPCVASGAIIAACSGSDSQDVISGTDASTSDSTTSNPDTGSTNDSGSADVTTDTFVVVDSGPVYDAGLPTVLDAGGVYEGGIACVSGGLLESEPQNNNQNNGDVLNKQHPTFCGATIPGRAADGGAGDVDYLQFKLENPTTTFFLQFAGNVKVTVTVETQSGVQTIVMTPTSFPPIPFVLGKDYTVKVESNSGQREDWRITLFQSP